ncbi:MAG: phosphatidylinositol mannoside acyltransferase [Acidimicrobiia bacterium]|nr:phosphatidylinositol mannoside acyltransferase [Acidimicrobiia bacterium]
MKQFLAYLGVRAAVGLVGMLPASMARGLGEVGGRIWHRFAVGRRTMAERHMLRVMGPDADVALAGRHVMTSYGRYWAEALWARARRVPEMLAATNVTGLDRLLDAHENGKGSVLALPHMGNWEAAAPVAVTRGIPIVAVAENLPNRRITDWMTAMRGEFGIEIVLATGSAEVMRKLEAGIEANKAIALLSDRDLKGRGVEVEFFGEKTTLPPGPAMMALRTGAPLFPCASYFTDGGYDVVVLEPIPVPNEGSRSEKVRVMTQKLAKSFEDLIRRNPDQWHLVQPNWPSDRAS